MSEPIERSDKAWVEHWARVGPKLERIRRDELRNFDHARHAEAIDALLQMGLEHATPRTTSGLVEMQRLFRRGWGEDRKDRSRKQQ